MSNTILVKDMLMLPSCHINLNNLLHNYNFFQQLCAPAECGVVIKNDAYGLGANKIATHLSHVKTFFVAYAEEGAELRTIVPQAKIVVFQWLTSEDFNLIKKYKLIPVISTYIQFEILDVNKFYYSPVAIQVETGLNRYGLTENKLKKILQHKNYYKMHIWLVMSHLACANWANHFMNNEQQRNFETIKQYFPNAIFSLAASDGVFLHNSFHYNLVRLGAGLYGINTAPYAKHDIKPVVSIQAQVIQITKIAANQHIGYEINYCTYAPRIIATIAIGYGDGMPRSLTNKGKIWFKDDANKYYCAPIVGNLSMDMLTCDITNIPANIITVGTIANITHDQYTINDLAKDAGTNAYEIISNLGPRIKRKYF